MFEVLSPRQLEACFAAWMAEICPTVAGQIIDAGGNYELAVKDNQEHMAQALRDFFGMLNTPGYPTREVSIHETLNKGHGRIETRRCTAVGNLDWLDTLGLKEH